MGEISKDISRLQGPDESGSPGGRPVPEDDSPDQRTRSGSDPEVARTLGCGTRSERSGVVWSAVRIIGKEGSMRHTRISLTAVIFCSVIVLSLVSIAAASRLPHGGDPVANRQRLNEAGRGQLGDIQAKVKPATPTRSRSTPRRIAVMATTSPPSFRPARGRMRPTPSRGLGEMGGLPGSLD